MTRVVLAEDDLPLRRLLAAELRRAGHSVLEVVDGAEALDAIGDLLSSGGEPVDVVITDVRMPYVTGLQILASLHGLRPVIPTIVITGFGDAATRALANRLGAAAVLDKPFPLDELHDAIALLGEPASPSIRGATNCGMER